MSRNKMFRRRYVIEFKGTTTNGFMVKMLDEAIGHFINICQVRFKQLTVEKFDQEDITTRGKF